MTKLILYLGTVLLLSGCVMTKSVGGYPVYGVVLDEESGKPIEGVSVVLKYWANSAWADHSKNEDAMFTDKNGAFHIELGKRQLWGGTGGLSGRIGKWPSIETSKSGYCKSGAFFIDPDIESYKDLKLYLHDKTGQNCE